MPKDRAILRCRSCGGSFPARRTKSGGWRTEFGGGPPSPVCRAHARSPLCRWAVHRRRRWLWRQAAAWFQGGPAAYVTLVPPRRAVPFGELHRVRVADELRSARRVLDRLPAGLVAVGWLDLGLREASTESGRRRFWVPHVHLAVAGLDKRQAKRLLGRPYRATRLVRKPHDVREAPTPRNALAYALKHADDIRADVVLREPAGRRRHFLKERWLKAEERAELRAFMAGHGIGDLLLLIGLRRFGRALRRV